MQYTEVRMHALLRLAVNSTMATKWALSYEALYYDNLWPDFIGQKLGPYIRHPVYVHCSLHITLGREATALRVAFWWL